MTGSVHTVLVPYWSQQLKKNEFFARQSSPRGGELGLKLNNDHILIQGQGQGTIVLPGSLHLLSIKIIQGVPPILIHFC